MPKFRVEYGYPVTNYSEFEVEAVDLKAAEEIAENKIEMMNTEYAFIEMIEEVIV